MKFLIESWLLACGILFAQLDSVQAPESPPTITIALSLDNPATPNQREVVLLRKDFKAGEQIPVWKNYDGTAQGAVEAASELVRHGFQVVE